MEDNKHVTVLEACTLWPENKSRAFQLNHDNDTFFFRLEQPEFINAQGIRSRTKCLKFRKKDGYLVVTNVSIRLEDEIKVLTFRDFSDAVLLKMEELLKEPKINTQKLITYETFGFLTENEPPSIDETSTEILP